MDVKTKEATATVSPIADDRSANGEFDVILSTSALDRDGDELDPSEWKTPLPEYITFDVDHGMSVEKTVGGGKPFINASGQLQVRGEFSSRPLAQDTRTLLNEGIIRNVSVAYMERKNTDGKVERELLNGAFVAIPANTEAVVLSSKGAGGGHKHTEPYGNVPYADPGFRNDVKRYPINTPEHVRAAWDYFHHANDRDKYSAAEQHHIEDEIRTAAKKFGIKLEGDTAKKDAAEVVAKDGVEKSLSESAADPAAEAAGSAAADDIELAKAKALALAIQLT